MYIPRSFRLDDADRLVAFMRRYSFCTLISGGDEPVISHVPVLVDFGEGRIMLTGHLARANPHGDCLGGQRATAIFQGPHSYVSPAWYTDTQEVPTWNYASVHATGVPETYTDVAELSATVDRMVDYYEGMHGSPWDRVLGADYRRRQLDHIVGFRLPVDNIAGKFKLGQNRSQADQDSMLRHLETSSNEDSRSLAGFIRRHREPG